MRSQSISNDIGALEKALNFQELKVYQTRGLPGRVVMLTDSSQNTKSPKEIEVHRWCRALESE